ncbi:MAG: hypothetical protein JNM95_10965, partial [Chitinophagaceae bacterium]|nr:hypothetical protein [Chitinophagaceae bacterium]
LSTFAQVPQKFNYQGVARTEQGDPIKNQNLKLKIAVLPTEDATVSEYEEIQTVKTNEFGLYTLQIGNGEAVLGDMKTVKWETGNKYIRVAIDPKGGNDFTVIGTSQLLSVPYAIYADKAGLARETVGGHTGDTRSGAVSTSATGTGTVNYLTKFTAANTIYNSQIFDNGTNIGIGTAAPLSRMHITTSAGNQEHLRMENLSSTSWGKFIFYNDVNANYHTFTKYGSAVAGNYGGASTLFPYANLLVFGSNNSPTVMANGHNIGFATVNGGTAYFKFIGMQSTGNVGLGGNSTPITSIHINRTDATGDTVKITNNTTGHTATDGLDIRTTGNTAQIINRENSTLALGTNNAVGLTMDAANNIGIGTATPGTKFDVNGNTYVSGTKYMFLTGTSNADKMLWSHSPAYSTYGIQYQDATDRLNFLAAGTTVLGVDLGSYRVGIGTNTPATTLDVNGTIKISGGTPGAGKVLTSDATGLASWQTPAAGGGLAGSGTTNYIPKFTPNGTTVGNSALKDSANTGLIYNANSMPDSYTGFYYNLPVNKSSMIINTPAGSFYHNYINLTSKSSNPWQGIHFADSAKYFNWFYSFANQDSVGSLYYNKDNNRMYLGDATPSRGFQLQVNTGKFGNTGYTGNANFNINTALDTAGYFTSTSSNVLSNGILRSEYTGTNSSDHISIFAKSKPGLNSYGKGIYTEGGYVGLEARSISNESWYNYGVYSQSQAAGNSYGVYGLANNNIGATTNTGYKMGGFFNATGGQINYGVAGGTNAFDQGAGYGGYFTGKQVGGYGRADSASGAITHYFGDTIGYNEAVGLYGEGNMSNGGFFDHISIGVAGESVNTPNFFNLGTVGYAANATYNYAVYGTTALTTSGNYAGYYDGNVHVNGTLSKSGGTFKIDHPSDPENKYLIHSFVESPDMMNVYNGNITTDASGNAIVSLPSYFEAENKDFKYQLTVVDNSADFVMAKVSRKVSNNTFEIKTSKPNVEVSWQVTGVRQDAWANANRVVPEVEKAAADKGSYLNPEVFGQPLTKREGPTRAKLQAEAKVNRVDPMTLDQEQRKAIQERENKQKQQEWKTQEQPIPVSEPGKSTSMK